MPRGTKPRTPEELRAIIESGHRVLPSGCHEWTGPLMNSGYGRLTWRPAGSERVIGGAHRLAYLLYVGDVPAGMVVDHSCHNSTECAGGDACPHRRCVNPAHLEAVPQRENVMRSAVAVGTLNAAKTHCPQGHPYDAENTYIYRHTKRSTTERRCKACRREYVRARQARCQERAS